MGAFLFFLVLLVFLVFVFLYVVLGDFTHDVLREVLIQRHQNTSLVVGYHLLTCFKKSKKLLVQYQNTLRYFSVGNFFVQVHQPNYQTFSIIVFMNFPSLPLNPNILRPLVFKNLKTFIIAIRLSVIGVELLLFTLFAAVIKTRSSFTYFSFFAEIGTAMLRVIAILRLYAVVVFVCLLTCHRRNPFQFFQNTKKKRFLFLFFVFLFFVVYFFYT